MPNDEFDDLFEHELLIDIEEPQLRLEEGERREVTVLFADVKGFTKLSQKLDPEEVHRRMNEIMKIFTRCITMYGGYVDKYIGDCIMGLFGAKKASEQDTQRAILAGLMMTSQLKLYNKLIRQKGLSHGIEFNIRVGINTGLVHVGKMGQERVGDYTVIGSPANLASRMESNAPVGRIMLPVDTMKTVEHLFDFERVGFVDVKGYDEPIECYLVKSPRHHKVERWLKRKSIFIGREDEMRVLRDGFESLGKRQVASIIGISGDAGLGKSRLVHEFAATIRDEALILQAICSGLRPTPFNLFTSLLENYCRIHVNEAEQSRKDKLHKALTDDLSDDEPLLGFLLGIRSDDVRLQQSKKDRIEHVQQAILALLKSIAEQSDKPVVLVLDDIHWIDESSQAVLDYLQSRFFSTPDAARWLVILMHRPDFELSIKTDTIELKPLSSPEITRLIRQHTSDLDLPHGAIAKIEALSAGNPFYLEEWCNYIHNLPTSDLKDFPVPANLHSLILSRLDQLDGEVKLLLQKAAVIGQEFFLEILHEIEHRLDNPAPLDTTIEDLERQSMILKMLGFDYSAYFFKHITTREVAYQTLLISNRKLLHKLTAEAIESIFPDELDRFLYALADHYVRAEQTDKALVYLKQSAKLATDSYANRQAIRLWKKYIELLPEKEIGEKQTAKLTIAEIQWLIGDWDTAEDGIKSILQGKPGNPAINFEAHRQLGICHFYRGRMDEAKEEFEKALKIATTTNDPHHLATAHGNLGIWHQHHKEMSIALEHHRSALSYAKNIEDFDRAAKTYSNIGMIHLIQQEYMEAEDNFQAGLKIAMRYRFQKIQSILIGNLGYLRYLEDKPEKAIRYYEQKWLLAEKMDDKLEMIKVLGNIGNIRRDRGEHREALDFYRRILAIKLTLGNKTSIAATHYNIAKELAALKQLDQAIDEIDKAIELVENLPEKREKYTAFKNSLKQG